MIDREMLEEYLKLIADRYTAAELCDLLDISVEEFLEAFEEKVVNNRSLLED